MSEILKKLNQQTCESLPNATFSRASEDGALPSDLRDGQTTDQSGQEAHHASHLALRGEEKEPTTTDTSPRSGLISSKSADLQSYLANKLQQRLPRTDGWTLYKMHWKTKATPRGRQYCQLVASTPRISASDYGLQQGWRTPAASDGVGGVKDIMKLKEIDPTPKLKLRDQAPLAGWVTPNSRDWKDTPWQTTKRKDGRSRIDQLPRQAYQIELTQPMRQKPNGEILTGYGAEMESGGQLNPAHSRWLMGYPPEWDDCGVTAMPSSRKSQRKSSK